MTLSSQTTKYTIVISVSRVHTSFLCFSDFHAVVLGVYIEPEIQNADANATNQNRDVKKPLGQ